MMIVTTTRKQSYFISEEDLATVELGSVIYDTEKEKMYLILEPGILTEVDAEIIAANTIEELIAAITTGGVIKISKDIDAPSAFTIAADTTITNNGTLTIAEDTVGDGVFKVIDGTLTLNGKGTINGLGNNPYSMAIWSTGNGKVIINDGFFTNVGAHSEEDGQHFDLIYASENGQVEINGGEFKCETPVWTLNIKNNSRETAKIVVKGGKFHGFDPSKAEEGNFVAEGYKVVEENGIFTVIPE